MKYKKILMYISIILLMFISIINLYNAKYLSEYYKNYYIKQTIYFLLGFFIIFLIKKIKVNQIFNYSFYIYLINIILLILVLIIGKSINGTKAWLNICCFSFQPSEFMKISLTLFLIERSNKDNIIKLFLYTLIPSILVFLEPDTGAIIFYLVILGCILINKKLNIKTYIFIIMLSILFIGLFIILYIYNQDLLIKLVGSSIFYRIERIINFKDNYQLNLSLISIFSSKFIRNGFNNILIYIPEGTTDFIISFIIGNFGRLSLYIILLLYFFIFYYFLNIKTSNLKVKKLTNIFLCMFLLQVLINIFMNIGLIPIIGITLPFLSYGGSSLLVYFIFIGLIEKLKMEIN